MKKLFTFLALLFVFQEDAFAQTTQQIGFGTSSPANTLYSPVYRFSNSSTTAGARSNIIYEESELQAVGILPGVLITQIAFNKTTAGTFSSGIDYSVYMGTSTETAPIPGVIADKWNTITNTHTLVYSSTTFNVPGTQGWFTITLDNPFLYTGGTLEISTDQDMTGVGATDKMAWEYTSGFVGHLIGEAIGSNTNLSTYKQRPNIQITFVPSVDCTGQPDLDLISGPSEVCPMVPFTLSSSGIVASGIVYQWQESLSNANTWTDIAGATSSSLSFPTGLPAEMDYRVIATCTFSNLSDTSATLAITVNLPSECYCIPEGTNSSRYINDFSTTGGFANISNLGSGFSPGGYGDFTAMTVSQVILQDVDFSTSIVGGTSGFRIWVDWNQNGIFEANEVAYNSTSYGASHSGSFTVPATAVEGETRMRIVSHWLSSSADIPPCETGFTYGEFEDYTFEVVFPSACSGTPSVSAITGANGACLGDDLVLEIDAIAESGITYQWQNSPGGLNNWSDIAGETTSILSIINGITVDTDYRVIITCTNSNLSDTSAVHEVEMLPPSECYCTPSTTSTSYFIDNFTTTGAIQNVNNISTGMGPNGYQDFTPTDTVSQVQTQEVSFQIKGNTTLTAGAKVWVDWNKNGVFDANEMVYGSSSYSNSHQGTFEVPLNAVAGVTRMRIGWHGTNSSGPTGPCQESINGEFEDYAFEVVPLQDCSAVSTPNGWDIVFNNDSLCLEGDITMAINEQIYASNVTYLFQQSTDGITWSDIGTASQNPEASVTDVDEETQFRVIWLCNNVGVDTAVGTVYIVDPEVATTTDGDRCGPGEVTLSATTLGGEIRWYSDDQGTDLLHTGNDFVTPPLTTSTTFWAAAGLGGSGLNDSLPTLNVGGTSCAGGTMFDLTPSTALQVDSILARAAGTGSSVKVYYREGGFAGFETDENAWVLHETITMNYATGNFMIALNNPIELNANTTYGIYISYNASYTSGNASNATYENTDLLFEAGAGLCSEFGSPNITRVFNGTIHYSLSGCESDLVPVEAVIKEEPVIDLGEDLAACEGHVFTLDAGPGFDSYLWNDNSTGQSIDVTSPGLYSVEVELDGCFSEDEVMIEFYDAPISVLENEIVACDGEMVELNAGNESPLTEYQWSTGDTTQSIFVEESGTYTVNIFNGACDIDDGVVVTFIEQSTGQSIHNTELGERLFQFYVVNPINVESYFWDFGDGNTSTEEQPIHEFAGFGSYDVTVQLSQESCFEGDSLMRHIVVRSVDIDELVKADRYIKIYPNPANHVVTIEIEEELQMKSVMIQDIAGRVIMERQFEENTSRVNLTTQSLASGIYQVVIDTNEGRFVRKLEIIK